MDQMHCTKGRSPRTSRKLPIPAAVLSPPMTLRTTPLFYDSPPILVSTTLVVTHIVYSRDGVAYRDARIFSTVAPSSGAVVLSALKIFEGYRGNYTDTDPMINLTTHRLIEATQFAYGQRTQCASSAQAPNNSKFTYYLTNRR